MCISMCLPRESVCVCVSAHGTRLAVSRHTFCVSETTHIHTRTHAHADSERETARMCLQALTVIIFVRHFPYLFAVCVVYLCHFRSFVQYSNNGKYLCVSSLDSTIRLCDAKTGRCVRVCVSKGTQRERERECCLCQCV